MAKKMTRPETAGEKKGGVFDLILLGVCIAVIACRATLTEAPGTSGAFEDSIFNTATGAFLILAAISWFISNICKQQFAYRFSGIEYGLAIFVVASVIGVCIASNKRAAINDFTMLVAPMLMAVLLTQLLNSSVRIKVLLYVIAALGAVNAYECIDQYASSNQMTISEYERDPDSMLRKLNIEKGSFQQMIFAHRLYSKDIRGFFTTGNSAGSFFLLALAAGAALVAEKRQALKSGAGNSGELAARGIVAAAIVLGLALTRSKGAIAAGIIAALFFVIYKFAGDWLARHKKTVIVVLLIGIMAGSSGIVYYGISHGKLPGGNSMLVRWQYWVGAAKIYAAYPFTGAGPGSFGDYYPTYKIPAGIETVKDPHNFVLSILAQYGPLGLIGFLAAILIPLGKVIFANAAGNEKQDGPTFRKIALSFLLLTVFVLLAVRPLVLRTEFGNTPAVILIVTVWLYILPAAIFAAAFLLLSLNEKKTFLDRTVQVILFCAIAGVIIHNLVDFAIFEPGVCTIFWATLAAVAAMDFNQGRRNEIAVRPSQYSTAAVSLGGFALMGTYMAFCVLPLVSSSVKVGTAMSMMETAVRYADSNSITAEQSQNNILQQIFDYSNRQLYEAAKNDKLSPEVPAFNARVCLEFYRIEGSKDIKLLEWAQNRLLIAIGRDPANFKNFEKLADVFLLLADKVPKNRQSQMLDGAFAAINSAIARYPGSERLRMEAGRIDERLGRKDDAIKQYKKAIEIEEDYRRMFAQMYPGTPIFSRMGESEYKFAKDRIRELSGK